MEAIMTLSTIVNGITEGIMFIFKYWPRFWLLWAFIALMIIGMFIEKEMERRERVHEEIRKNREEYIERARQTF